MFNQKTIAVIGSSERVGVSLISFLAGTKHRVLCLTDSHNQAEDVEAFLPGLGKNLNVEVHACAKEACWEADIIAVAVSCSELTEVLEKIKEVVTQKIVLTVREEVNEHAGHSGMFSRIKTLLPFSMLASLTIQTNGRQGVLFCEHTQTHAELSSVFSGPEIIFKSS